MDLDLEVLQDLPAEEAQTAAGCKYTCGASCAGTCPATCPVSGT
jgi:hypothetical protein